jgi:hypothetical protein
MTRRGLHRRGPGCVAGGIGANRDATAASHRKQHDIPATGAGGQPERGDN